MQFSSIDQGFMQQAIDIARQGLNLTHPNPRVGCVIVKDKQVIAAARHTQSGGQHAEVLAIEKAEQDVCGATCYVTLEPCAHHGKTPPCIATLIRSGIQRVVIASQDPNPLVQGRGIKALQQHGISVEVGCLAESAEAMNPGFFSRFQRHKPWIRLKMAMSLDGRTADQFGKSQWISGVESRQDVHLFRAKSDAIISSASTVMIDDPQLTARLDSTMYSAEDYQQPLRVIIDSRCRIKEARIFSQAGQNLIFHDEQFQPNYAYNNTQAIALPHTGDQLALDLVMSHLAEIGINEVWCECGKTLAGALLQERLVDEIILYVAPLLIGDTGQGLLTLPQVKTLDESIQLRFSDMTPIGADYRLTAKPVYG